MDIEPDDVLLHKLKDAARRYAETRNAETQAEYLRLLELFADLVLRNRVPSRLE